MKTSKINVLLFIIVVPFLLYPYFKNLGAHTVRYWDESRYSTNAIEIIKSGNPVVLTYNGQADLWGTKPPLGAGLIALSYYTFGFSEFSLRLPSALCGFLTALSLVVFCAVYFKNTWLGIFSAVILSTANGYIDEHAVRTGDLDSLLCFFIFLSVIFFYQYVQRREIKNYYLSVLFFTFAFLAKSAAALIHLPALFIFALMNRDSFSVNRKMVLAALCSLFVITGFYLYREHLSEGYISAALNNEFGARFFGVIENHSERSDFYIDGLINSRFYNFYFMIPLGFLFLFLEKNKPLKSFISLSFLFLAVWLTVISIAKTKVFWYDVPLFPFLSIIAAYALLSIISLAFKVIKSESLKQALMILIAILVFFDPCKAIVKKVTNTHEQPHDRDTYALSYYLRDRVPQIKTIHHITMLHEGYHAPFHFYREFLKQNNVEYIMVDDTLRLADQYVVLSQAKFREMMSANSNYAPVDSLGEIMLYRNKTDTIFQTSRK